jgi:hypothetical protein
MSPTDRARRQTTSGNRDDLSTSVLEAERSRAENAQVHTCRHCGNGVEDRFRFCPWCAVPQRSKLVEFFTAHPDVPGDAGRALRVSRYFASDERPAQVRFSIWSGDSADAAVSLSEEEAARLVQFVSPPAVRRPLLDHLRDSLRL